jgi:hypothetical protein
VRTAQHSMIPYDAVQCEPGCRQSRRPWRRRRARRGWKGGGGTEGGRLGKGGVRMRLRQVGR